MIRIDKDKCIGCGLCVSDCFPDDIILQDGKAQEQNQRCFSCGHCVAICPVNAVRVEEYDESEVLELAGLDNQITPEQYLNHLKSRRSIRHYTDEKLSKDEILQILETGRFSPTGGNRQNVAYHVITEELDWFKGKLIDQLAAMGEKMLAAGQTRSFYTEMWIQMAKEYHESGKDRLFFDAPCVIVISSSEGIAAGLAAAHMEDMIYSMNLGMLYSGYSKFAISTSEELQDWLCLKDGYQVEAVLVVGHPAVKYQRTVSRKAAEVTYL